MSSINSSNKYDDTERKFGISSYTSTHEGFAAVVKGRYSDFVVHEGTSSICAFDVCTLYDVCIIWCVAFHI